MQLNYALLFESYLLNIESFYHGKVNTGRIANTQKRLPRVIDTNLAMKALAHSM